MKYCNECASLRGYRIHPLEDKVKGTCDICHRYVGPCNFISDDELEFNIISSEPVSLAGFDIKEIKGFPVGQRTDMIDPGVPHKIVGDKKIMFMRRNSIVLADMNTGKRVEIKL